MILNTIKSGIWSDPTVWNTGNLPTAEDIVIIYSDHTLLLTTHVKVKALTCNGELKFKPNESVSLRSSGNIVIEGLLSLQPENISYVHDVIFTDVDITKFVGGGNKVLDTDTGLWVMNKGQIILKGSYRTPYITFDSTTKPDWQLNDPICLTPNYGPKVKDWYKKYTYYNHGQPVPNVSWGEAINMTRNVRIFTESGNGKAHILFHTETKPIIENVLITNMGTEGVLGRYPLHFHHCMDFLFGTVIKNVLITNSDNRAYVTHASHGITLEYCTAHNTKKEAYWWDQGEGHMSNNIVWFRCLASKTIPVPTHQGYSMPSFMLGSGVGNQCIECIAVGNACGSGSSGFGWPEDSNYQPNKWVVFFGCISHDHRYHGGRGWQNDSGRHVSTTFKAYNNGGSGWVHGAYRNSWDIQGMILYNNNTDLELHATPTENAEPIEPGYKIRYKDCKIGTLKIMPHTLIGYTPVLFKNCTIDAIYIAELPARVPNAPAGLHDFVNCNVPLIAGLDKLEKGSLLRFQYEDGNAYQLNSDVKINTFYEE